MENYKGTKNASAKFNSEKKNSSNNSPGKSPSGDQRPSEGGRREGGGGSAMKKKKKKLQSGGGNANIGLSSVEAAASTGAPAHTGLQFQDLGPVNVNPTRQYLLLYPSYYVPSSPYTCAGVDQDWHHFQSPPLVSFEIFSDENVNGCSVI